MISNPNADSCGPAWFPVELWKIYTYAPEGIERGPFKTVWLKRNIKLPFPPYPGLSIEMEDGSGDGVRFGPLDIVIWDEVKRCFIVEERAIFEQLGVYEDQFSIAQDGGWEIEIQRDVQALS